MIEHKKAAIRTPGSFRGYIIAVTLGVAEGDGWICDPYIHLHPKDFLAMLQSADASAYLASLSWWRTWRTV